MKPMLNKTALLWFRNDLRTYDHDSLSRAVKHQHVIGVYFFDPRHYETDRFGFVKTGKFRTRFLLETVQELRDNLERIGIPLLVFQARPEDSMKELIQKCDVQTVYLQREWTSEETSVLNAVKKEVGNQVLFVESYDQFLFHPDDLPYREYGEIPNIFTHFRKQCERHVQVQSCQPIPKLQNFPVISLPETKIPCLEDLGFEPFETDVRSALPFSGGEDQARKRINHYLWESRKLSYYKHTRNGLIGIDYSSKLSPWLANGSLSPRMVFWEIKKYENEVVKNQDTYWLVFELIWRDYFKYVSLKFGNRIFHLKGILDKTYAWQRSKKALHSWIEGTTSESFVNANMKELATTGWMSNRGRQNVASYWAKELEQDWRIGAAYFESLLIDYDVHSNWGNWMYNSGVGNDPRNRKFNVGLQADRYDPAGKYRRLWLQETLF